uniref:sensor histidine kinase n=1 Tax=Anaerococcus mediterraneensis TaxID=1870984 RepID=UPI0009306A41|nr:ATP-binding protein [Anaerococcus mediterraneensis]
MNKLTKKSLIISITIASIFAMVFSLYTKIYMPTLILYLVFFLLLLANNIYIDKKLDEYSKSVSKFDRFYDFDGMAEDFEDAGKIYRKLLRKNVSLEKNISLLKRQIKEIKNIASNMEEGFIVFDGKGSVELINDSAKSYLLKDESTNLDNLIDDKDYKLAVKEAKILSKSKSLSLDLNGYHLKVFIDPISENASLGFVVIVIDYSESRKAELMRKEFSSNVSHELKSPLTSINGYAELIATGIAKEDDIEKFAKIIYEEGNRLLDMIDDIIRISKLDDKGQTIEKTYVDVKEEMDKIIEKFKRKSDQKSIKVENNLASFRVYTSRSLFTDLLTNIYENAIKYNVENGDIIISSLLLEKSLRIFIKDTGVGISGPDQKRVFERFYVADKARDRNVKSTGLGLSIAKHIADFLDMDIKLESKLGQGSTFIIDIKIDDKPDLY